MTHLHKRLALGASFLALAAALPYGAARLAEREIHRDLTGAGLTVERVQVSMAGHIVVEGLAAARSHGTLKVGRIEQTIGLAGLVSPARAQSSSYAIDNLSFAMGSMKLDIPKVTVEGGNFAKDDIPKIFAVDAGMVGRLKSLSAKSVSVPEMRIVGTIPDVGDLAYTVRNLAADNIQQGRIEKMAIATTTYSTKGRNGTQSGEMRSSEVRGIDMVQSARIYFETAKGDEKPAPVYDSYVIEGMRSTVEDKAAVDLEVGRVSTGAMRMRPLKEKPLVDLIQDLIAQGAAQKAAGNKKPDPATLASMFENLTDMMEAVEDDGMTMENMRMVVGERAKPDASFSIAKIEGSFGGGKMQPGYRVFGIDAAGGGSTVKVASMAFEGFSYTPMFRGMAAAMRAGDPDFKRTDPRKLIPTLGTVTLAGVDIDVPDPATPKGIAPERLTIKLAKFLIGAKNQINGIPTKLDFAIDNLAMKLPEHSSEQGIRTLRALGYSAVDMSARLNAQWNEASKELQIAELSLGGAGMGKARISGTLGNIGREIFEADLPMAQVALMGATAKAINLELENQGLAEKAYAMQARAQSRKPDDLRRELGTMAALGIPAVLGTSDSAKAISGAVAKFLTQPKSLRLDVKARNAGGIGIPDMVTIKDPQKALELVNVSATAE